MNHRDMMLNRLVTLHQKRLPLPAEVTVDGELIDTKSYLESFRSDKREAWPAIVGHMETIQRPLVCEVALSLG
jgi:hypothetical protein